MAKMIKIEHCELCPFYSRQVRFDQSVYFWCRKDTQVLNGSEVRYRIPTWCPLPEILELPKITKRDFEIKKDGVFDD
jgi:hypothetical protein